MADGVIGRFLEGVGAGRKNRKSLLDAQFNGP